MRWFDRIVTPLNACSLETYTHVPGADGSPEQPDDASGKILHATSFSLNTTANTLTASLSPALVTKKNRVEVRFLFDNAPLCAVYNGELSGPDSVYATIKHYGIVAQSWRANVTVRQNGL